MTPFERELVDLIPRLRRFARSLAKDAIEADDLCQAAIERALRYRDRKRPEGRMDGWMFMILRNQWLDLQRHARRQEENVVRLDADDTGALARDVASGDDAAALVAVDQAFADLLPEQREAAALVWVEGYSYREAAELLEIPIGTLTSRLSRARSRILSHLEAA
jgi:RNA polymerase sigma factor (sigma-70 family)